MEARHAQITLIDSFSEESEQERSGVRARVPLTIELGNELTNEPSSVYAAFANAGHRRLYFLGTLFSTGVIESDDWEARMQRDGVANEAIASAHAWLRTRTL